MKKTYFPFAGLFPVMLMFLLLVGASCARSPYNFVKVQPRPFDNAGHAVSATDAALPAKAAMAVPGEGPQPALAAGPRGAASTAVAPSTEASAYRTPATPRQPDRSSGELAGNRNGKSPSAPGETDTREVVHRELKKSAAFGALPAKKLKKVEKIITRQAERLAKKSANAAAAPAIGFNQFMRIGVILLLVGLVVGIAFADLGYLVAVIGVVFLVLGLIQQI